MPVRACVRGEMLAPTKCRGEQEKRPGERRREGRERIQGAAVMVRKRVVEGKS